MDLLPFDIIREISCHLQWEHLVRFYQTSWNIHFIVECFMKKERFDRWLLWAKNKHNNNTITFRYNEFTYSPLNNSLQDILHLNLNNLKMISIPLEIGRLVMLQELSLSKNCLISIPSEIGQLVKLEKLVLSNNQLQLIPSEIGKLIALQELYLSNNKLVSIPPEIGKLNRLTDISLHKNELLSIPQEIGNLNRLETLYLDHCQLHLVPRNIDREIIITF